MAKPSAPGPHPPAGLRVVAGDITRLAVDVVVNNLRLYRSLLGQR